MIGLANRVGYRIRQVHGYVFEGSAPPLPETAAATLLPGTIDVFRHLPAGDQRHLIAVHAVLTDQHASDDVLLAGLLHDIGKVYNGQRIGVATRCFKVVMDALAPSLLLGIVQKPAPPRWTASLWIAGNHARIGADILVALGYSARVCWLVEYHEHAGDGDAGLAALKAADNSPMTVPQR